MTDQIYVEVYLFFYFEWLAIREALLAPNLWNLYNIWPDLLVISLVIIGIPTLIVVILVNVRDRP